MQKQITERLPGIYEIKLFQDNHEIRIFLVAGNSGQRSLLIDTCFQSDENREILNQVLGELQIAYQDLDVFLTHKHHDHTGLASYCAAQGATIYMNPVEDRHPYDCLYYSQGAKSMEEQEKVLNRVGVTAERTPALWNCFKEFNAHYQNTDETALKTVTFPYTPIGRGQLLSYGDYTFQVISLAGHTLGQLGLYEKAHQIVFSADHILANTLPVVGTSYVNEHLLDYYFKSLDQFKIQYHTCTIFPAHGDCFKNPSPLASNITAAYRKKLLEIQHLLMNSAKAVTVQEVAFRIYGVYNLPTDVNGFFKMKSILSRTFSCLEYLYDQKYCDRMEKDGMLFYR